MSINIRPKPAVAAKSDLDPRVTDRQSTDFEATMWTGASLIKPVEQRFPIQPAMPGPQPPPNPEDRDPNLILQRQFNILNNEIWQRALRHSNQAAIAKYIANMHLNEKISEEQSYRHMSSFHELDKAIREEITRHSILRRISLTRAAHFFAKLSQHKQRDYINEFQLLRASARHEQDRINKWNRHEDRTSNTNMVNARQTAVSEAKFLAMTIEAERLIAKNLAARKYEAIASQTIKLANSDFESHLREVNNLQILDNAKKRIA